MNTRGKKMDITLNSLLDIFLSTKQTEGKSPSTVHWYRGMVSTFLKWLGEDKKLRDFTLQSARSFVAHLQTRSTRYDDHPMSHQLKGGD